VLDNLLSNAVKHSPGEAPVSVFIEERTDGEHHWALVDVVDEGPGIPEDLLPHIFERFTTGHTREGGLGLGLYIAKRIAVAHGGDLTVARQPSKGTRFTLRLPVITGVGA
jgi:signal transduction histidine kinase